MSNFHYEWVLFDLDDTLFDFQKSQTLVLEQLFRKYGLDAFPQALPTYLEINHGLWAAYQAGQIGIDQVKGERFRRLLDHFSLPGQADEMEEAFRQLLGQAPYLMDGAKDLLDLLKPHTSLAVVTNGILETQLLRLQAAGLKSYFDHLFVSSQMGVQKPNKAYFDQVKIVTGITDSQKVLLIGDNPIADIQGGLDAGFHTLWLNAGDKRQDLLVAPTYQCSSLGEAARLLGLSHG